MTASVLGMARVSFAKPPVTHDFRVVAVEVGGTKFWFPSVFVVKKGDKVRFHAVSKIPGKNNAHGFKIQAFNIEGVVGEKEEIFEFDANQEGIFSILCHMHPAHIGGQLVVQAK